MESGLSGSVPRLLRVFFWFSTSQEHFGSDSAPMHRTFLLHRCTERFSCTDVQNVSPEETTFGVHVWKHSRFFDAHGFGETFLHSSARPFPLKAVNLTSPAISKSFQELCLASSLTWNMERLNLACFSSRPVTGIQRPCVCEIAGLDFLIAVDQRCAWLLCSIDCECWLFFNFTPSQGVSRFCLGSSVISEFFLNQYSDERGRESWQNTKWNKFDWHTKLCAYKVVHV